jgi:hypothetical protein
MQKAYKLKKYLGGLPALDAVGGAELSRLFQSALFLFKKFFKKGVISYCKFDHQKN